MRTVRTFPTSSSSLILSPGQSTGDRKGLSYKAMPSLMARLTMLTTDSNPAVDPELGEEVMLSPRRQLLPFTCTCMPVQLVSSSAPKVL